MKIINRRASFDYEIISRFEAGLSLLGSEVKSLKLGRGDLTSAFVRIRAGEAWLVGANIPPYGFSSQKDYDPIRSRRVLLHKKEIVSLGTKVNAENLTLVPVSVYNKGPRVKLEVALARGKKEYQKKEQKKKRDIDREIEREVRGKDTY